MKTRTIQLSAWATFATIVLVTVVPIGLRPADLLPVDLDRALAFALLAGLFTLAYPRHWLGVAIAVMIAAFAVEALQALTATRHARFDDAAVKAAGALAGVSITRLLQSTLLAVNYRSSIRTPSQPAPVFAAGQGLALLNIESRSIRDVYFDQQTGKLRLRFRDGQERFFADVPEQQALAIACSESPGRYYVEHIKPKFRRIAA